MSKVRRAQLRYDLPHELVRTEDDLTGNVPMRSGRRLAESMEILSGLPCSSPELHAQGVRLQSLFKSAHDELNAGGDLSSNPEFRRAAQADLPRLQAAVRWLQLATRLVTDWRGLMARLLDQSPVMWSETTQLAALLAALADHRERVPVLTLWPTVMEWACTELSHAFPLFVEAVEAAWCIALWPADDPLWRGKRLPLMVAALVRDVGVLSLGRHLAERTDPLPDAAGWIRRSHARVSGALSQCIQFTPCCLSTWVSQHHAPGFTPGRMHRTIVSGGHFLAAVCRAVEMETALRIRGRGDLASQMAREAELGWWDPRIIDLLVTTMSWRPPRPDTLTPSAATVAGAARRADVQHLQPESPHISATRLAPATRRALVAAVR